MAAISQTRSRLRGQIGRQLSFNRLAGFSAACVSLLCANAPAFAAGEVLLTQAAAITGGVTPGDAPGYPITLSQPGSYQLAGNLTFTAGVGIEVTSPSVTIDFKGFLLDGSGTADVGVAGNLDQAVVRGGSITGVKFNAINGDDSWTVENMQISGNGSFGSVARAVFLGNDSRVLNSTIVGNLGTGITCFVACVIRGNVVSDNTEIGIYVLRNGLVLGNTITKNGGYGVLAGIFSTIHRVTGYGNNTIVQNGARSFGEQAENLNPLNPNACRPVSGCP